MANIPQSMQQGPMQPQQGGQSPLGVQGPIRHNPAPYGSSPQQPQQQGQGQDQPSWMRRAWEAFKEWTLGTPEGYQMLQSFTPEQQDAFHSILQQGLQQYQNPYEGFEALQNETERNFNEKTLPQLGEQFGASRSRLSSPTFGSQVGAAAGGLHSMLNAQKAKYGMENRQQGLQAAQLGLTPPGQQVRVPGQAGSIETAVGNAKELLPYAIKGM